jgi:hypothetical protein
MGPRLFSALLEHLQEPYEDHPMIDKLHRLGKLGYLPKLDDWQSLRVIRNRFADDPEDDALKAAYLNEAISAVPLLLGLMAGIAPVMGSLQGT